MQPHDQNNDVDSNHTSEKRTTTEYAWCLTKKHLS